MPIRNQILLVRLIVHTPKVDSRQLLYRPFWNGLLIDFFYCQIGPARYLPPTFKMYILYYMNNFAIIILASLVAEFSLELLEDRRNVNVKYSLEKFKLQYIDHIHSF